MSMVDFAGNGIKFTKSETLEKERAIDERKIYEINMACSALKLETLGFISAKDFSHRSHAVLDEIGNHLLPYLIIYVGAL